jgi:hypothetical protein
MTAFPPQSHSPISRRAGQILQAGSLSGPRRLAAVAAQAAQASLASPTAFATLAADDGEIGLRSRNRRAIPGVASAAIFGGCSGRGQKQTDGAAAPDSRCRPRGC